LLEECPHAVVRNPSSFAERTFMCTFTPYRMLILGNSRLRAMFINVIVNILYLLSKITKYTCFPPTVCFMCSSYNWNLQIHASLAHNFAKMTVLRDHSCRMDFKMLDFCWYNTIRALPYQTYIPYTHDSWRSAYGSHLLTITFIDTLSETRGSGHWVPLHIQLCYRVYSMLSPP
jgi:hypothetical protein